MSWSVHGLVMKVELRREGGDYDAVAKAVLMALSWSLVDQTGRARLSVETISQRAHYKERAVRSALKRLEGDYQVIAVKERSLGPGASALYEIKAERLREFDGPQQRELRLTSLRAVERGKDLEVAETPLKEAAPDAAIVEAEQTIAALSAAIPEREAAFGAGEAALSAKIAALSAASRLHIGNHACHEFQNTSLPLPPPSNPAERERGRSKFQVKEWYAWALAQPDTHNPVSRAGFMSADAANDPLMELWLEVRAQDAAGGDALKRAAAERRPAGCDDCRRTPGWFDTGQGLKPCACAGGSANPQPSQRDEGRVSHSGGKSCCLTS